jgi:aquaglyceroporin related protein, other eukaryote
MVAVLIGVAGNLQVKTSDGNAGNFTQEAAMWGLGTMMAIYIAGGISGAHCSLLPTLRRTIFDC